MSKKAEVIPFPEQIDPVGLFEKSLHDVLGRLIASNKIVLELAKIDPALQPQLESLIVKARKYVITHMRSEVGVRKMAREKWGMK